MFNIQISLLTKIETRPEEVDVIITQHWKSPLKYYLWNEKLTCKT